MPIMQFRCIVQVWEGMDRKTAVFMPYLWKAVYNRYQQDGRKE